MEDGQQKEEVTVPDALFTNLEKDFEEAMQALDNEESLGHFKLEYEKLYRALVKSHASEVQLVQKCQEMTQELLGNAAKMQAAIKLSQGDHSTIEALKKEIEKAWRTVDAANEKDVRAREMAKTLKEEIASLQAIIEEGSSLSTNHTVTLEELKLENKRLQMECDEMMKQSETAQRDITELTATTKKLESEIQSNEEDITRLVDRAELVKQELRRERNARERAEYQCRELLFGIKTRESETSQREAKRMWLQDNITALRTQNREATEKRQVLLQKMETAERQLFHSQQSYTDCVDTTADLNERIQDMEKTIVALDKKISEVKMETERAIRVKQQDFKELGYLRQKTADVERVREGVERQKTLVKRRTLALKREKESLKEALSLLHRERAALEKKGVEAMARQTAVEAVIKSEVVNQEELDETIAHEKEISLRLKGSLDRLEKEREKCFVEVSQINTQHISAQEELKMASIVVEETQKRIDESDAKLNVQQARYEHIRAERNQFSKKLVDAQDEIVELKQKFKMMDHQITQFKEELQMKEKKFQEETYKQKSQKDRLSKAIKIVNEHTALFDEAKRNSENISQQIKQFVRIIGICDKELSAQQHQFLKISNQRDLLGTQLIRRNDELTLLYEKLKVQQETVRSGEAAYNARLEDLRLLRLKKQEVRRQAHLAHTRVHLMKPARERVAVLERELALEQVKTAALSEEVENPLNNARWRKIEGHDPTMEELDAKQKDLQRRLITKSEEALDKELTLQEKNRLVSELYNILARQPGPDVARHLNAYSQDLQRKNVKMKEKASELNMTTTHIAELKYEAERLRRELHDMKRRYFEMKLKNSMLLGSPRENSDGANLGETI